MYRIQNDLEAVIFDLDGTLVDSMWIWKSIDIEFLGRYNIPMPEGLQETIGGMSIYETALYFRDRFGIREEPDELIRIWNGMALEKYSTQVPLKDGALSFLDWCERSGIPAGIASSNSRELVGAVLARHKIADRFETILTGSDSFAGKPAPDIYLAAAGRLGADPSRCLVFEDIIPGIVSARNAGMQVCAVDDADSRHMKEEKIRLSDGFVESFRELILPEGLSRVPADGKTAAEGGMHA